MKRRRRIAARVLPLLTAAVAAAVIWGTANASSQARQGLPDGVTPEMVEQGRELFTGRGLCYTCHGQDGTGRPELGGDLTDGEWAHGDGSYGYLVRRIKEGVSAQASSTGVPMPPRAGTDLTDAQVEAVAAYVWTLSRRSAGG